jgi:hypothetical protein
MNDDAFYEPVGNGTEVGLIKFLQDAEIPVHEVIKTNSAESKPSFLSPPSERDPSLL